MRKVRNSLKKAVGLVLSLAILMSVLPFSVFATEQSEDPKVLSLSMDESRTYITIEFDRELEVATTSSLYSKIRLSKNGASLATIPSSSKVTVSGTYLRIKLSSSLTLPNNYFAIAKDTFVGQTDVIETPVFDASDPKLLEKDCAVLNSSEQTVTLKFNSKIDGFPNSESLKNGYIELARTGSSFNEVIPNEDIEIDKQKGEITIYLETWLTGSRVRFRIAAGKLQNTENGNINLSAITTPYIDASKTAAAPEIDYTSLSSDRSSVTIYFTDKIKNSFSGTSIALSLLKSHVWVSRGSSNNYETLAAADKLTLGTNYLKIDFDDPLTGSRNYIKIDAGSLTDYYGYTACDTLTTDNITSGASAVKAPVFQNAFLSSNNRVVLYFDTAVKMNPSLTTSQLRSNIYISRNGGSYVQLSSSDSFSFSDTKMTINLKEALSGSNNRIRISGNSIASSAGAVLTSTITTGALEAGMSDNNSYGEDSPEYSKITYDEATQRVRIYFKDDIRAVSSVNLRESISVSRNGGSYVTLSTSDAVSISPSNVITILLSTPLTGSLNAFRIAKGALADYDSGYVLNTTITTDYVTATGSSASGDTLPSDYSGDVTASLSDDFYTVTLKFNEPVYNTSDSLDDLKNKIQISRNGRFETLSSNDYVRLNSESSELLIVLAEPANEYFSQIKLLANALSDADGNAINKAMTTLPLGEADGNVRTYINDVAVADLATAQSSGSSTVISVSGVTKFNAYGSKVQFLAKAPSSVASATLNIMGDVADFIRRNGGTFALSLDNATFYIPAENLPTLASGDTLSLTIESSTSATSQKLTTASSSNSFKVESSAKKLSAKIIDSSASSKDVTHTVFSDKRFMIKNPANNTSSTVVRIEASGAVVPVPSSTQTSGGVVYITAKTRKDGNYAAISASHSFTNTPSWVATPANTLGSRLILDNVTGSDIKASEAISRSETVSIMAKTLGIFGDMSGASPFFDMISTDSYFNAVMSTVSYELISGYPDGTFKPSNKLTRAEAMTIVARAIRFMNGDSVSSSSNMTIAEAEQVLSRFTDAKTVDNWAKVDIAFCVNAGVVNGDNNGRLNPKSNVTRAELIQLMYNILNKADLL